VSLAGVRPGQGWNHTVEEGDDEIEIAFRDGDGTEVNVEIELDD
jgi:hypothetical protein